ncbi:MAG TPA: DNA topoisomerase, partial [Nitrososphaeraceae archaeon]|nr:DNA topoisomerase [Nitrososphaeraceae archaeon]
DFFYGVNLSRALTQSFKNSNNGKRYYNLSIGRVQGPTLAFVVDKETEIRKHIPVPYWNIHAEFEKNDQLIEAQYCEQKVMSLSEATSIVKACTGQSGRITEIKTQMISRKASAPFNLGDLQREAYRVFKFSPSFTLKIAEKLYLRALISYPRTSSQKIPPSIDYKKIILGVSKISLFGPYDTTDDNKSSDADQSCYKNLAMSLLSQTHLSPIEGSKTDPAHPAIYPTGEKPTSKLDIAELKIFDLIIKRFFAAFGKPSMTCLTSATIQVKNHYLFESHASKTIYEGWMFYYKPYINGIEVSHRDQLLPLLNYGDILKNISTTMQERFTRPPPRFNQATLLEQMEKHNIGTKATRADIISTLFKRNYISNVTKSYQAENTKNEQQRQEVDAAGGGIEATEIGFEIIESMRKHIPEIVSLDLTRSTELQLDGIESGRMKSAVVLENAIDKLKQTVTSFKRNEIEIGQQITDALTVTRKRQQQKKDKKDKKKLVATLGLCPVCSNGQLNIIRSSRTKKRFVGCSNYKSGKCKVIAPLPQSGSIQSTGKKCTACQWPVMKITDINHTSQFWTACVNSCCPSKNRK